MILGHQVNPGTDLHIVFNRNAAKIKERTGVIDKYPFAKFGVPAKIGVKGYKNCRTRINS